MSQISYIVHFTIAEGQHEAFKRLANGYIEAVQANEPGTLLYQWYIEENNATCLLHESFDSSESLLTHLGNVGPSLPELLAIAPITHVDVLGSVSDAAREALAALGAVHHPRFAGFTR